MTHVTCRLTAKNRGIGSGTLRSVIEYGLPFTFYPGEPVPERVKPIWILLKQETVSGSASAGSYASLHLAPDR